MIVVGLTGSIAMGKSTVAAMFAEFGVPIFDADEAVRDVLRWRRREIGRGGVSRRHGHPDKSTASAWERACLGDADALRRLEGLVHPAVADARARFLERAAAEGRRLVVVDVPLLLETGGDSSVDLVVVVSAPEPVQRARALAREGMTEAKLDGRFIAPNIGCGKEASGAFRH